jgi:hypothetical protein
MKALPAYNKFLPFVSRKIADRNGGGLAASSLK